MERSLGPEVNFEGKVQFGLAEESWPGEINGKGQTVYLRQFLIFCFIEKIKVPHLFKLSNNAKSL